MESAPPSYEAATVSDVLTVIAPYISTSDLHAATLVSKRFLNAINPRLWGNPALYVGLEHDGINDFLTRFQKTLTIARLSVRSLVHTLHIPSSYALYFDDRPADWLAKLLQLLPSLQSLIVDGLSNLDHAALQGLRAPSYQDSPQHSNAQSKSNEPGEDVRAISAPSSGPSLSLGVSLKLLNASHCVNLTVASLAQALPSFTSLICLDLSYCTAAKHPNVLAALGSLWHLKILRLKKVGLTDEGFRALANAVSRRVASLDVSDNLLTDKSVEVLLQSCIGNTPNYDYTSQITAMRPLDLGIYRSAGMEASVICSLTRDFINRLAVEKLHDQGVTHLYLPGNQLSLRSLDILLSQHVLSVLDIGDIGLETSPVSGPKPAVNGNSLVQLRMTCNVLRRPSTSIADADRPPTFRAGSFPRLKRLILTAVPQFSSTDDDVAAIITLVEDCARESQQAKEKAMQDYTLPPGRHRSPTALRDCASRIFALQVIVLELAPERTQYNAPARSGHAGQHKSFTDDADSESLWNAAEADFSFFSEGQGSHGSTSPAAGDARQRHDSLVTQRQRMTDRTVDNLALLSAFRTQRRLTREKDIQAKGVNSVTPGYWDGVIEIIRR